VARRARAKNRISENTYRPHVPAAYRILLSMDDVFSLC
jgi:hypothetical protein